MSQDQELKGHSYDGITEYDNPLPTWWIATFMGTIIFAFLYFVHYEIGGGPTLKDELKVSMKELESLKPASAPVESEEELKKYLKDPNMVNLGMATFQAKCAACHGPELQGLVGPNLTDKNWIHGKGHMQDIVSVIRKGVPEKGMPAWEAILKNDEVISLATFIYNKKGSNPPNAKAPQGELIEE